MSDAGWTGDLPPFPAAAATAARDELARRRARRFADPAAQRVFIAWLSYAWQTVAASETDATSPRDAVRDRADQIARLVGELTGVLGRLPEPSRDEIEVLGRVDVAALTAALDALGLAAGDHAESLRRGRGQGEQIDPRAQLVAACAAQGWRVAFAFEPSPIAGGAFGRTINAVLPALGFSPLGDDALRAILRG